MSTLKKLAYTVSILLLLFFCRVQADDITGTDADETLTGTNTMDNIDGRGGNDTINGLDGNDNIQGGDGIDTIDGGVGEDTIDGGNDNDTIRGGGNKDDIRGGLGDDTIDGGDGNDRIRGGDGKDTINGGPGDDRIVPGQGADIYTVADNDGNDRIVIRTGDVPAGQTETVRCGSGRGDTVKFIGFGARDQGPNPRQFTDPDTGGIYVISPDCENIKTNDDLAYLDPVLTPSTTCAASGADVTIAARDFPPLATIAISIGEQRVGEFQTNDLGAFDGSFKVPDVQPNTYRLMFADADSDFEEYLFFTVAEQPALGTRSILLLAGAIVLAGILIAYSLSKRDRRQG